MYVRMIEFKILGGITAPLVSLESNRNVPFEIKRIFYLFGISLDMKRGKHAHKTLQQLLVCVRGKCKVLLDDGSEKRSFLLDKPELGLYMSNMIWLELSDFSEDCVLLVLADQFYDEGDYIRNYEEFLKAKRASQ